MIRIEDALADERFVVTQADSPREIGTFRIDCIFRKKKVKHLQEDAFDS